MNHFFNPVRRITVSLCVAFLSTQTIDAKEIIDMAQQKVEVISNKRIFPSAPPMMLLTYLFAPERIVALTVPSSSKYISMKSGYLDAHLAKIPVVGGWHGNSAGANIEALMRLKPDLVIGWKSPFVMDKVKNTFEKWHIPVLFVQEDRVEDEPKAIAFVAEALGQSQKGKILSEDAQSRLKNVKQIASSLKEEEKPIVYYVEGLDGLATECASSFHHDPIAFVGVKPAIECVQSTMAGMEKVSMEKLLSVNPDIIIVQEKSFFDTVFDNPKWKNIKAVQNKKVYLVPKDPINFLDRPPSFVRVLGVEWLASVIHPDKFNKSIQEEVISFYKLYFRRDLTPKQAQLILAGEQ